MCCAVVCWSARHTHDQRPVGSWSCGVAVLVGVGVLCDSRAAESAAGSPNVSLLASYRQLCLQSAAVLL